MLIYFSISDDYTEIGVKNISIHQSRECEIVFAYNFWQQFSPLDKKKNQTKFPMMDVETCNFKHNLELLAASILK